MNFPKTAVGFRRVLGQFGGAHRIFVIRDRLVTKHVSHPLAEAAPQVLNYFVHRATMRACVAAVLNQRQLGVRWSQNMVLVDVNRRIKLLASHMVDYTYGSSDSAAHRP